MEYPKYYPPHYRQAMRDAYTVNRLHPAWETLPLCKIKAIRRDIFEDADLRLAGGGGFLHHPPGDPRRWPHFKKLRLARASAKSSTPKSKLTPKKDRQLYQIKLALREYRQISLSKRLAITSCKQKKITPKKPSFSDTWTAGLPLNGGKGFHSGWTNATEQPKIDVGTQRAQARQKR